MMFSSSPFLGGLLRRTRKNETQYQGDEKKIHHRLTCSCGAARAVGREDGGRLVDGEIAAGNGQLEEGGGGVDESQVLRGDILGEEKEGL